MNYPGGIKKEKATKANTTYDSNLSHKNRGMTLESEINITNEYYREIDKAYIYKKPTPIKIVKVDYPSRDKAKIKEAYFTVPSTTDYNGLYKGKYIDFEAKETKSKTAFALTNIHPHQIEHLKNIDNHKGIAFLIVRFTSLNETYLLPAKDLLSYIKESSKKSIPINLFREKAYLLKDNYMPRIDYLKIVDILIGGKNNA
ncbi:MAG: Holliday junction resolvase RecU [Bacilli bacterium]|nr:Holliday junction resolvase RecU [Bacilli bacterium]